MNFSSKKRFLKGLTLGLFLVSLPLLFQNCGSGFQANQINPITQSSLGESIPSGMCGNTPEGGSEVRTMYQTSSVPFGSMCAQETQTRICRQGEFGNWTGSYTNVSCSVIGAQNCGNTPSGGSETRVMYQAGSVPYGSTCKQEMQTRTCMNGVLSSWSGNYTSLSCMVAVALSCGTVASGQAETRVMYQASTVPFGSTCLSQTQSRTCTNGVFGAWSGNYAVTSCIVEAKPTIDFMTIPQGVPGYKYIASNNVTSIYSMNNTLYVGTDGGLSISTDGGSTFTTKTTVNGLGSNLISVLSSLGNTLFVGTSLSLSLSTDGGNTFTLAKGLIAGPSALAMNGNTVFALINASSNFLNISTDGGRNFSVSAKFDEFIASSGRRPGTELTMAGGNNRIYIGTKGAGLVVSSDGGNTFAAKTTVNGLGSNEISSVYAVGDMVYAGSFDGSLSISSDGGNSFTSRVAVNNSTSNLNAILKIAAVGNSIYLINQAGNLFVSTDGGSTFNTRTQANGLSTSRLQSVATWGSTVIVGMNTSGNLAGGLAISNDGGNNFKIITTPNSIGRDVIYSVFSLGNELIVSVGSKLVSSSDGGNTFANKSLTGISNSNISSVFKVGNTVYVGNFSGNLFISTDGGLTFPTSTKVFSSVSIDAIYAVGDKVYVGSRYVGGGLAVSTDGGKTFTTKTTLYNNQTVYVSGISGSGNDNTLYVVVNEKLLKTVDDGTSYTLVKGDWINEVLVVGNTIYAASGGSLWISKDSGKTWVNKTIQNGLTSGSVNSLYMMNNTLYIGTWDGLSRGL